MIRKYLNIKFARALGIAPKAPVSVHIEVTKRCNARCKMCDIWKQGRNPKIAKQELTTKQLQSLAEQLGKLKVKAIGITGGEPMLRQDIAEIIKAFKNNGMIVHLNTNGTIPNTAERLKHSGVDSVTVSIDFYGKEHDKNRGLKHAFEKAVQTLKDLKKAGIKRIGIGTVIMNQNPNHFEKLTKLADELGVFISFAGFDLGLINQQKEQRKKHFQKFVEGVDKINQLRKKYSNISVLPAYLDYMKKQSKNLKPINWCYAGFATCIVKANGDVAPCYQLSAVGNLKNNSFKEIWNSEKMSMARKRIKNKCGICFANCIIEPSIVLNNPFAALQFYMLKWRKVK